MSQPPIPPHGGPAAGAPQPQNGPDFAASPQAGVFTRAMKGDLPDGAFEALDAHLAEAAATKPAAR